MKTLIAVRPNNALFNSLMIFSGLTFMLVWLPLLRCLLDGESYSWGQNYFGMTFNSTGIESGYFILIPFLMLYLLFFYSFYWIKNRTIFYVMLTWFWIHNFGNLIFDIVKNGDTEFHGDTLNVHVSISSIVIPLSIIALIWIIAVVRKDKKLIEVNIPWNKSNTRKALIILAPLPIQAIFYATGEAHGLTDEISVIITIIQSFLVVIIFFPKKNKVAIS